MERLHVYGAKNGYDDSGAHNGAKARGDEYKLPSVVAAPPPDGAGGDEQDLGDVLEFTPESFSNDEWEEIKRQFQDFDLDGNGFIEVEEFIQLCEHIGLSRDRAIKLSILYDEDGDGVIDFKEFAKHDIVSDLKDAVENQDPVEKLGMLDAHDGNPNDTGVDMTSHVNVAKILQVVRAKIDNSNIAFAFGRYCLFTVLYVYVAMMQKSPADSERYVNSLKNYFVGSMYRTRDGMELKHFEGIVSVEEIWDWLDIHFVQGLFYVPTYYNGQPRSSIDANSILEHQKLTGGFRLTQRRARQDTCSSGKGTFKKFARNCYGELYLDGMVPPDRVEKQPFYGLKTGAMYKYESKWFWDSGYYQEFDMDQAKTIAKMNALKQDMWFGPATQWARLDFVLYNPNIGQFAIVEAKFEIRPTGLVVPNFDITTRRNGYYQTTSDWTRMAVEIAVVIGWFMYVYGELGDARKLYRTSGKMFAYFTEFWNVVDIIHLLVNGVLIMMWLYIIADSTVNDMIVSDTRMTMANGEALDFTMTAMAVRTYYAAHGFNMLISVIRILKFFRQNAYLGQLTDAFELMRPGLVQFAVVLFIAIFMFTAMGVILFGSKLEPFTEFLKAVDSIMGYTVGYGDPMDLFQTDSVAAMVFYYPFTFLMAFFVLPLTIAVIMDGYSEMQTMYETARATNLKDVIDLSYPDQLYRGFIRSTQFFIRHQHRHPRLRFPAKQEVLRLFADMNKVGVVPYTELRQMFRDKYISEEMLVEVIKKYNAFEQDPELTQQARNIKIERDQDQDLELAPLIEHLQLRADQLVRDQQAMQRKLDLLCEIFPPPPIADSIEQLSKSGGKLSIGR